MKSRTTSDNEKPTSVTRGGCYVVDNLYDTDSAVAVRCGYFVYHGRTDPYSARNSYYRGALTGHSRAKSVVDALRNTEPC